MPDIQLIAPPEHDNDVPNWIADMMNDERPYLLAHADDGVIWGKWLEGGCRTSDESPGSPSPRLRGITLQQAFIFGLSSEIRLFRTETGTWKSVETVPLESEDKIVEHYILWGDEVAGNVIGNEFTHVRDKVKIGLEQVLPLRIEKDGLSKKEGRLPRLEMHHYITYDPETGEARIGSSRLVDIGVWTDKELQEVAS